MRKVITILAAVLALAMLTASVAVAGSERGAEKEDVIQDFDKSGTPTEITVGKAQLIRRADGIKATADVSGLTPGGVYTFWWVIPNGADHPVGSFVALGGSKTVGQNGMATARMTANVGAPSIEGFFDHLAPLNAFPAGSALADFDAGMLDDTVRVEVAYHGQADQAADAEELALWKSDFWTGQSGVCADLSVPTLANTGQPFCPVAHAAVFAP
jgi:hypothetical protein